MEEKQKYYYKWFYFLQTDIGAYPKYLQEQALKGKRLVAIRGGRIGVFEKIQPQILHYEVVVNEQGQSDKTKKHYAQEGWDYVGQLGKFTLLCFKSDGDVQHLEGSQRQVLEVLHKTAKEVSWMPSFAILFFIMAVVSFTDIEAESILSSITLLNPIIQFLVALYYIVYGYYAKSLENQISKALKTSESIEVLQSVEQAKRRGVCMRFYIGILISIVLLATAEAEMMGLIVCIALPALIGGRGIRKLRESGLKQQRKYWAIFGAVLLSIISSMVACAFFVFSTGDRYFEGAEKIDEIGPLKIQEFTGYEACITRNEWINEGSSFLVKDYFHYNQYTEDGVDLDVNHYSFVSSRLAAWYVEEMVMENKVKEKRGSEDILERMDVHVFEAEEVYATENLERIILRNGGNVLDIETRDIYLFDPINQDVIEQALER